MNCNNLIRLGTNTHSNFRTNNHSNIDAYSCLRIARLSNVNNEVKRIYERHLEIKNKLRDLSLGQFVINVVTRNDIDFDEELSTDDMIQLAESEKTMLIQANREMTESLKKVKVVSPIPACSMKEVSANNDDFEFSDSDSDSDDGIILYDEL